MQSAPKGGGGWGGGGGGWGIGIGSHLAGTGEQRRRPETEQSELLEATAVRPEKFQFLE